MKNKKFLFKTAIDALIAGLISIGVFHSPTLVSEMRVAYFGIVAVMMTVLILMIIYIDKYKKEVMLKGVLFALGVSFIEIMVIGFILGATIDMIIIVFSIVFPSVIIFDKLLG